MAYIKTNRTRRPRMCDAEFEIFKKITKRFGSLRGMWEEYRKKTKGAAAVIPEEEEQYLHRLIKTFGSLAEAWEKVDSDFIKNDIKLSKQRSTVSKLKSKNKALIKENLALSRVVEVQAALKDPKKIEQITFQPSKKSQSESVAILQLGDWHVEEEIKAEAVNDLNELTPEEAAKRIQKIAPKAIKYIENQRHLTNVDNLIIAFLGDLLSGYIHSELEETNSMSPPEATVWLQTKIIPMLDYLLDHGNFKKILAVCKVGNHGRTTKRYRHKTGIKNSYEFIIYKFLQLYYQDDPRISFQIDAAYNSYVKVYGYNLRFHHGHYIRYNNGVLGLNVPVGKWIAAKNQEIMAHYDFFGHFHKALFGGNWLSNGSLSGVGEYVVSMSSSAEAPQQILSFIEKSRGLTNFCRLFVA